MHCMIGRGDDPEDTREFLIHHNGDFSGDCEIHAGYLGSAPTQVMKIPVSVLFQLVAKCVRSQRISTIEQMTDAQLLGLEEK